ncbi:F-box/FBD/LRR-repeat protein At5g56420-like [Hibiscus syriacus]|uniref:F-box/FBD/LRR-repeat protein At5g56420-like n=1 Tax=Hibiscus syriacus TaxID=106335 RepID=UPI001920D6DA|nr:F-box/FBD/LRR-repeat protein At5g56420-like [Hibiscus syriacus]
MAESIRSPSKPVHRSNDEDNIDRISDLPDSILCHILTFLPTNMSVATSILSKRWIDLWSDVPILSYSTEFKGSFADYLDKAFTMCQAQKIHKFSLDFKLIVTIDEEHLVTWISAAIDRNVRELKFSFCSSLGPLIRLPVRVFSCRALVCLKLFDIFVDVPTNACFQRLKILQLERVLTLESTQNSLTRRSLLRRSTSLRPSWSAPSPPAEPIVSSDPSSTFDLPESTVGGHEEGKNVVRATHLRSRLSLIGVRHHQLHWMFRHRPTKTPMAIHRKVPPIAVKNRSKVVGGT